jgi:hypothetical protein
LIIEVDHGPSERADADCSAALVARPIVHIADVDHPSTGELIIATDLAAPPAKPEPFVDTSPPGNDALASPKAPPTLPPM